MPFEKFDGSKLFGAQSKITKEAERIKKETEKALKNVKALPAPAGPPVPIAPPEESPGKKPNQPFTFAPGRVIYVDDLRNITPITAASCAEIAPMSTVMYLGKEYFQ